MNEDVYISYENMVDFPLSSSCSRGVNVCFTYVFQRNKKSSAPKIGSEDGAQRIFRIFFQTGGEKHQKGCFFGILVKLTLTFNIVS